jgi:deoxyribose-phosphate aldolase
MVASIVTPGFAGHLELALPRPETTRVEIEKLCAVARAAQVAAVLVSGCRIEQACALLEDTEVKVCATIGFPHGAADADVKRYEIEAALDAGAQEFDAVFNHGWLKDGDDRRLERELRDLVEAADERPVKFILEPGLLTREELRRAVHLIRKAEAYCVGLGTGFGPRPATQEDLGIVRSAAEEALAIKFTAPVEGRAAAEELLALGVLRLGVMGLSSGALLGREG